MLPGSCCEELEPCGEGRPGEALVGNGPASWGVGSLNPPALQHGRGRRGALSPPPRQFGDLRGSREGSQEKMGGGPRAKPVHKGHGHETLAVLTQTSAHQTGTDATYTRAPESHSECPQHVIYPRGQFYLFLRWVPRLVSQVETTAEGPRGRGELLAAP